MEQVSTIEVQTKIPRFEVPKDPILFENVIRYAIAKKLIEVLMQEDFINIITYHEADGVLVTGSIKVI